MDLTPSQLSSLDEMGIPVWALRSQQSPAVAEELTEQALHGECLVIVESHSDKQQAHRLLHAMLFAIGLKADQFTVISAEQLAQIEHETVQQKLLIVLGEQFAQSLWGKSVIRGQQHQTIGVNATTVVSFDLDKLLTSPENKALAWQDLQLAKNILDAI